MAGGGAANSVPVGVTSAYSLTLFPRMVLEMLSSLAGPSPYNGAFAYNPEDELDGALTEMAEADAATDAYGTSLWATQVSTATTQVDNTIYPTSRITTAVSAFEADQATRLALETGRLAAGMADAGSALSSAFPLALAMIELEGAKNSDKFEAELHLDRERQRFAMVFAGASELVGILNTEMEALDRNAKTRMALAQMTIQSQSARLKDELYIDVQDQIWDLGLFTYAGNFLASYSGGVSQLAQIPTQAEKVTSNALGAISALGPLLAAL